jgi:hypothetical protein
VAANNYSALGGGIGVALAVGAIGGVLPGRTRRAPSPDGSTPRHVTHAREASRSGVTLKYRSSAIRLVR